MMKASCTPYERKMTALSVTVKRVMGRVVRSKLSRANCSSSARSTKVAVNRCVGGAGMTRPSYRWSAGYAQIVAEGDTWPARCFVG